MIAGQLYRLTGTVSMRLYGKVCMYLGEAFIHRDDGVTVENHRILIVGESNPRTIDRGVLKYMEVVNASR